MRFKKYSQFSALTAELPDGAVITLHPSDGSWSIGDNGGYDTICMTPASEKALLDWLNAGKPVEVEDQHAKDVAEYMSNISVFNQ